jgi:hypothetical protein
MGIKQDDKYWSRIKGDLSELDEPDYSLDILNLPQDFFDNLELNDLTDLDSNSKTDWEKLDKDAFKLGYDGKDFEDWYGKLSFDERADYLMQTVRESYYRGLQKKIDERQRIPRLCIFISGKSNIGKAYAAVKALKGNKILKITDGEIDKIDTVKPVHNAIVISDNNINVNSLLNISDNYIYQIHDRFSDRFSSLEVSCWCGKYLIVTSNLTFEGWIKECELNTRCMGNDEIARYETLKSRFYLCEIEKNENGINELVCTSVSELGSIDEQLQRKDNFIDFQNKFNKAIKQCW